MSFDDSALGESAALHDPAGMMEVRVLAGAAAPAAARRAVRRWLGVRATDGVLTDAPLVVSELVTNSVRHAGLPVAATVRISAELGEGVLRLEVEDAGTAGAVARRTPGGARGGGFGLNIVDTLAARWGVERGGATLVWAEFTTSRC
jgi:anti-sigma regulatory factor (Ser/Thr protein kinase)